MYLKINTMDAHFIRNIIGIQKSETPPMHLGLLAPAQDDASCDSNTDNSEGQDIVLAEQPALLTRAASTSTFVSAVTGGTARTRSLGLGGAGSCGAATRSGAVGAIARRTALAVIATVACICEKWDSQKWMIWLRNDLMIMKKANSNLFM